MKSNDKNRRILIIDDNEAIHEDFKAILGGKPDTDLDLDDDESILFGESEQALAEMVPFELDSAFQGQEGLEMVRRAVQEGRPYSMAFVDIRMPPGWDGIETIQRIWKEFPSLQVIICTAHSDYSWKDMIDKLGQTDRLLIVKKPFENIEVRQMACSLCEKWHLLTEFDKLLKDKTRQITETRDITVFSLAKLAESRDPEIGEHLEHIQQYSQILADQLGKEGPYTDQINEKFKEDLFRSSPLHDIGKVGIPDAILLKPGNLTESEFKIMEQHTVIGAESLAHAASVTNAGSFLVMAAEISHYHHERFDGSGYPEGLKGTQIPLSARILALADVYDALMSKRVYKPAFMPEIVKKMIIEESGKHFDPVIVEAFEARYEDIIKVSKKDIQNLETTEEMNV